MDSIVNSCPRSTVGTDTRQASASPGILDLKFPATMLAISPRASTTNSSCKSRGVPAMRDPIRQADTAWQRTRKDPSSAPLKPTRAVKSGAGGSSSTSQTAGEAGSPSMVSKTSRVAVSSSRNHTASAGSGVAGRTAASVLRACDPDEAGTASQFAFPPAVEAPIRSSSPCQGIASAGSSPFDLSGLAFDLRRHRAGRQRIRRGFLNVAQELVDVQQHQQTVL